MRSGECATDDLAWAADFHVLSGTVLGKQEEGELFGLQNIQQIALVKSHLILTEITWKIRETKNLM